MSLKIDSDLGRFKDIIRGKVKNGLDKFVASDDLIGQQNGKLIKIPLKYIDLPRFVYGSRDKGGVGQGPGESGDPSNDGSGKSKSGGDDEGEHEFSLEFTPEELAQILMEHLNLPKLEDKGKGKVHAEKSKYNKVSHSGSESLRHFRKTFKEALKRDIATGTYNPDNPKIIPIKEDKRYKSYSTQQSPEINTVAIYMMDVSGSMEDEQKHIVKSEIFWIDLILKLSYKDIESVFIIHDSKAREVSREDFFKVSTAGGTHISSAYKLCSEIIEKEYPYSEWNIYPFHFTDGDNYNTTDSNLATDILSEKIFPNCNTFSYGQVKSPNGSGDFMDHLGKFVENEKLTVSQINEPADILTSIKSFFEEGK
jgi:uncharacterized sporulation protein YeaH/YhbH (DUF444 family)